jgi:HK97 family phage major capsid protein
MEELKRLQEEVSKTFETLKEYNDKAIKEAEVRGGEATAETRAIVDKANNDITELRKEMAELEKRMNRPKISATGEEKTPEMELREAAFEKYIRYGAGETAQKIFTPDEKRALGGSSDADGGFLVPPSFESGIIMNAYNLAEMRPVCQVGTTGRDVVHLGALSKPSVAWGRANIAVTQQSLTTGGERITIFNLRALTLIANNTLDDADADIVGEMTDAFARAIAEAEDSAFAAGAGDDSPQGVSANTSVQANYVASGVSDALSDATNNGVDGLFDCFYKPKKTYRTNGTWAMNSTTESVVRKLKDGEGQYLWQPAVEAGKPATLLGKAVINPEGLADIAANAFPIIFGDFNAGFKIRDRAGLTVQRLVERYAEYDQTGFMIKKRVGGQVTLAEAFACVKIAAS